MKHNTDLDFSVLESLDFDVPCTSTHNCNVPAVYIVYRIFPCCGGRYTSTWCKDALADQYRHPTRWHEHPLLNPCGGIYNEIEAIVSIENIKK